MYLVENTQELMVYYKLAVGDVLVFARLASAEIIVCGRQGTKEDGKKKVARRACPPTKAGYTKTKAGGRRSRSNAASGEHTGGGGTEKTSPTGGEGTSPGGVEDIGAVSMGADAKSRELTEGISPGEGPSKPSAAGASAGTKKGGATKSKRSRQQKAPSKKEKEGVNNMYEYWNGLSLPARKDGVFRAVPATAEVVPNKVTAQHGHWTAVVNIGGEFYQAFFDSRDAAVAAYNAAVQ